MNKELQIVPSFKDSLFDDNTKGMLKDIVELGIDSVMQDGLLKDIPIVSTLVALGKFGVNVYDLNLLKQTIAFLNAFNNHTIDEEKLDEYRDKINGNPKKAEEELGRVIILLNNNVDDIKSRLLACYYSAYINEDISWGSFCELSDVISRIFVSDLQVYIEIYRGKTTTKSKKNAYRIERLNALGLLDINIISRVIDGGNWDTNNTSDESSKSSDELHIKVTSLGNAFCQYGLLNLYNK